MKVSKFNADWFVRKEGEESLLPVTLPYDCMIHEKRDPSCENAYNTGYYPGGKYVYSKGFTVDGSEKQLCHLLHFDGVYRNATILLNGEELCKHQYGYGEFEVSLDAALRFDEENHLQVIVDNSETPNSRWFSGSGITRNVYMLTGNATHIAFDGLFIKTLKLSGADAALEGQVELVGDGNVRVKTRIFDGDLLVAETEGPHFFLTVHNARLWDDVTPNLYTAKVELWEDNELLDTYEDTFGIRLIEYSCDKGFRINGRRVFLNGGCLHNDNGIIGAASLEDSEDRRARKMKEAGFNAVRSAHNPMSRVLVKACDKYGLYVMDEAFDMWFSLKTAHDFGLDFRQCWEAELKSMVHRDRNHPSIVMYSLGNEIIDLASPRAVTISKRMRQTVKELDDTRPTVICANLLSAATAKTTDAGIDEIDPIETRPGANTLLEGPLGNKILKVFDGIFRKLVYTDVLEKKLGSLFEQYDIVGYNYTATAPYADLKKNRKRLSCATETYLKDFTMDYQAFQDCPNAIGDFAWTGWDYIGEATVGDWNYGKDANKKGLYREYPALSAGSGLIDLSGYITPNAHYRNIVLGQETGPYITVRPLDKSDLKYEKSMWRLYDGLNSWSFAGYVGKTATVQVFSNADSVTLYLDEQKVATSKVKEFCAVFKLPYKAGVLKAVSFDKAGNRTGESSLRSAGSERVIHLRTEDGNNHYGKDRLVYVDIDIADKDGITHVLDESTIELRVDGSGVLMGLGTGRASSADSFCDNKCHLYQGHASAAIRTADAGGMCKIEVISPIHEKAELVFQVD